MKIFKKFLDFWNPRLKPQKKKWYANFNSLLGFSRLGLILTKHVEKLYRLKFPENNHEVLVTIRTY